MLTIVIPTNRPTFLKRALTYYYQQRCEYKIIVADSSPAEQINQNELLIKKINKIIAIEHRQYDPSITLEKVTDSLKVVNTPYTIIGADDDFFILSTLSQALQFIDTHPKYAIVHGDAVTFGLSSEKPYGPINNIVSYEQRTLEHATAIERLFDHLFHYSSTWYSIHRTEQLQGNIIKTMNLQTDIKFREFLPSCLSIIQGKVKKIDSLYIVRQGDGVPKSYVMPNICQWIAHPNWIHDYRVFQNILSESLVQYDNMSLEQAQNNVDKAFWMYISPLMFSWIEDIEKHNKILQEMLENQANTIAEQSEIILKSRYSFRFLLGLTWEVLKHKLSILSAKQPNISHESQANTSTNGNDLLNTLLNPDSPYYADFKPIYQLVTSIPPL